MTDRQTDRQVAFIGRDYSRKYLNEVTTRTDSRHFDSPPERRLFEDVAGVSENRCIKHGSSSTVVDLQTTVGVFFKTRTLAKMSSVSQRRPQETTRSARTVRRRKRAV